MPEDVKIIISSEADLKALEMTGREAKNFTDRAKEADRATQSQAQSTIKLGTAFSLAAAAVAFMVQRLRDYIDEANAAAATAQSFGDLARAVTATKIATAEAAAEAEKLARANDRIATSTQSAADAQKDFAAALQLTSHLETERLSARLAAEEAAIEANPNLSPEQKAQAKAAARGQFRSDREELQRDEAARLNWSQFFGGRQAQRDAAAFAGQTKDLAPQLGKAKADLDAALEFEAKAKKQFEAVDASLKQENIDLGGYITDKGGTGLDPAKIARNAKLMAKYGLLDPTMARVYLEGNERTIQEELDTYDFASRGRVGAQSRYDALYSQFQSAAAKSGGAARAASSLFDAANTTALNETIRRPIAGDIMGFTDQVDQFGVQSARSAQAGRLQSTLEGEQRSLDQLTSELQNRVTGAMRNSTAGITKTVDQVVAEILDLNTRMAANQAELERLRGLIGPQGSIGQ
jgi:hypothetical protein